MERRERSIRGYSMTKSILMQVMRGSDELEAASDGQIASGVRSLDVWRHKKNTGPASFLGHRHLAPLPSDIVMLQGCIRITSRSVG